MRDPEGGASEAGEVGELDDVDGLDAPFGPEQVFSVAGRVEPSVQGRARCAVAAVCDVEVLAPGSLEAGLNGDVVRVAAEGACAKTLQRAIASPFRVAERES